MNTQRKKGDDSLTSTEFSNSKQGSEETVLVPDVPVPDIYSGPDPYAPTEPNLKIIDIDSDDPEGFDPYDTAVLVKK